MIELGGCSHTPQVIAPRLPDGSSGGAVELSQTSFFPQETDQCGPAALATVLNSTGLDVTPAELTDKVFLPGRKGSLQIEMLAATRRYARLPYLLEPDLTALLEEVRAGRPVLVLQNLGLRSWPVWHYAVVIGYQPERDEVILRSGVTRRLVMPASRFLKTWSLAGTWGMVALLPGELPVQPQPLPYLEAAAALEANGQAQAALKAFHAAAEQWPDRPEAWLGIGNSLYALGRLADAETAYRDLLQRFPDHPIGYNNLAQAVAERGCPQQALEILDKGLRLLEDGADLTAQLLQTRDEIVRMAGSCM